jgi:hypothetical protein
LLNSAAANSQLANVLRRGGAGEELTADERYQFRARTNALFRYWEDVHYQYRQGLYDEEEFSKHKEAWRAYLAASKGAVAYWCEVVYCIHRSLPLRWMPCSPLVFADSRTAQKTWFCACVVLSFASQRAA